MHILKTIAAVIMTLFILAAIVFSIADIVNKNRNKKERLLSLVQLMVIVSAIVLAL